MLCHEVRARLGDDIFCQSKLDGERIQLHAWRAGGGAAPLQLQIFSRGGNDSTARRRQLLPALLIMIIIIIQ